MKALNSAIFDFLRHIRKVPVLLILGCEIVFGLGVSFLALQIFWEMSETVLSKQAFFFDSAISSFFFNMRSPILTPIMRAISFVGMDGMFVLSIFVPIFFYLKKKKHEALVFTIMISLGALLNIFLKFATQRPRPIMNALAFEPTYGFPSWHSMNGFIFFTTLAYFYYYFTHKKKRALLAFGMSGIIILLVGISRIYLGVHYPSDVLGGYVIGLCWFALVLVVDKTITFFGLYKQYNKKQ